MACGSITIGQQNDCESPFQGGLGSPDVTLINNDEFTAATLSGATPGLVTAITLASAASAYRFEGFKTSLKPSFDLVLDASGRPLYKHRTALVVYANTQLQKNNLERLANGRVKAIIENAGKDANAHEILGLGIGLEMKPQKIRDLQENGGAFTLLLETPDTELERKMPQTFLSTDYAGTKTAILALLFLPTITVISDLTLDAAGGNAETITGTNFHGSGSQADVSLVQWKNRATGALTTQTSVTVASATSLTFTSVALTAGTYNLRVTTSKGYVDSTIIVTVT